MTKEYTSCLPLFIHLSPLLLNSTTKKVEKANLKNEVRHARALKTYGLDKKLEF